MNRLEIINPKQWDEVVKNGHPTTIKFVVDYLVKSGKKIKVYKDVLKPQYILELKNQNNEVLTLKYKNGIDLLNDLKDAYFKAKEEQENELMRQKIKRLGLLWGFYKD